MLSRSMSLYLSAKLEMKLCISTILRILEQGALV
jgi:hypothetical protein